jgi:hypothetical protein
VKDEPIVKVCIAGETSGDEVKEMVSIFSKALASSDCAGPEVCAKKSKASDRGVFLAIAVAVMIEHIRTASYLQCVLVEPPP